MGISALYRNTKISGVRSKKEWEDIVNPQIPVFFGSKSIQIVEKQWAYLYTLPNVNFTITTIKFLSYSFTSENINYIRILKR